MKKKGVIWNSLGSTMFGVNSFIMLTMVGRFGKIEDAGVFGIAFTTAQLMYIIGLLGINHYQQTDYMGKYSFSSYLSSKLASTLFMYVGAFAVVHIFNFSSEKAFYTYILTLLMALNSIGELFQSLFFQKNRLDLSGACLFYRTFWSLIAFCAAVLLLKDIKLSLIVQILVNASVTFYYAYRYIPEMVCEKIGFNRIEFVSMFKLIWECFPLFISTFLMNVVINSSKYGIEVLMDDNAQGYYNLIFMPAQVINLLSLFIFKPLLNDYATNIRERKLMKVRGMLYRQITIILILTVICGFLAFLIGTQILGVVFTKDLSQQKYNLALIVLSGGIYALCQLIYYVYVIIRKQKIIMVIYIIDTILTSIFTYFGVKYGGITGAAISFGLTQTCLLSMYALVLHHIYIECVKDASENYSE